LSLPVILTNLLLTMPNIADVLMVGRLGPVEIAAVGIGNSVRLLVLVVVLSISTGAMSLAAQAKGARDPKRLSFVVRQALSLLTLGSLVLGAAGWFFSEPILRFLNSGGDPQVVTLGTAYLQILFLGTVFMAGNFTVSNLMQGAGDTVTPLYLSAGVNVLNVLFNAAFIFGFGPIPALGVVGAAIGTLLARSLGMGVGIALFYTGRNVITLLPGSYWPHVGMFRDILAIGIPSGLQGLVRNTSGLLVIRIVTSTSAGSLGAAALAIGLQIESLAFMPGLAVNIAATSLVGRSLGAWQVDDARRQGNTAIALGVVVMTVIGIPILIFAPQLILMFEPSANPTVVEAGISYLHIITLSLPILAVAMVTNGALRGAADTLPGLIGNLLGRWLTVVPLAWLLGLVLDFGVAGVWWAIVAGTAVASAYVLWRWRSDGWIQVALRKTELYRNVLRQQPTAVQQDFLSEVRAPLMGRDGTTEHVDDGGIVTYRLTDGAVRFRFDQGGYRIVAGGGLLDGGAQRPRPPRPARP
jgi:putative MATE family efflux protein